MAAKRHEQPEALRRHLRGELDEDLKSLRGEPRFTALIAHAKTQAPLQATN